MSASDFYTGIVPEIYTALRGTTFDAARYVEFVGQAGQPALELGCGDDGPFFELLRRGVDVDGVDSSQDMLDRCHARADAEGLQVRTYCQPMQELALPRTYRAIYLVGPTFTLLPDDDAAYRTLQGIAAHLHPDGRAMVPLWIPEPTPAEEFGRVREARTADGALARYTIESEEYDSSTLRTRRTHTRYELQRDDQMERVDRVWTIHWHDPDQFVDLARSAGLVVARMDPLEDREFTGYLRRTGTTG
ncbi:class I SAM-dependent methyltransferase [Arthrobacter echini]|uniref:Class I SAM-dependent methyltransferase n=1 Tax=Arthrobacter echini TaxID=1529066 RepID=A0A4S5E8G3_9MICC|nr:class I SAM-dependent methyltransferase [Arthrobacter echini]THJ67961.1 class I SAM-dependent methyltransferase [Arthrobacter echini]